MIVFGFMLTSQYKKISYLVLENCVLWVWILYYT